MQDKKHMRVEIKKTRRSLSSQHLEHSAQRLNQQAKRVVPLQKAKRIFSYAATAGEISPHCITQQLSQSEIYLPFITHYRNRAMQFYSVGKGGGNLRRRSRVNRYGIVEPIPIGAPKTVRNADVVLVPLLAFDRQGNRMGMGGGFYDTALAFRQLKKALARPLLVGLAHNFQERKNVPVEPWDIPLDVIITDTEIIRTNTHISVID